MGWYGHSNSKPPVLIAASDDAVGTYLSGMSKAALADLAAQCIAALEGSSDDAITVDQLRRHAEPVLRVRGDKLPKVSS